LLDLYGFFATGAASRTTDAIERVVGRPPIRFEQFAREYAPAFS